MDILGGTGKLTERKDKLKGGGRYRDIQRVKRKKTEELIEEEQRNAQINTSLLVWGHSLTPCNAALTATQHGLRQRTDCKFKGAAWVPKCTKGKGQPLGYWVHKTTYAK